MLTPRERLPALSLLRQTNLTRRIDPRHPGTSGILYPQIFFTYETRCFWLPSCWVVPDYCGLKHRLPTMLTVSPNLVLYNTHLTPCLSSDVKRFPVVSKLYVWFCLWCHVFITRVDITIWSTKSLEYSYFSDIVFWCERLWFYILSFIFLIQIQ